MLAVFVIESEMDAFNIQTCLNVLSLEGLCSPMPAFNWKVMHFLSRHHFFHSTISNMFLFLQARVMPNASHTSAKASFGMRSFDCELFTMVANKWNVNTLATPFTCCVFFFFRVLFSLFWSRLFQITDAVLCLPKINGVYRDEFTYNQKPFWNIREKATCWKLRMNIYNI